MDSPFARLFGQAWYEMAEDGESSSRSGQSSRRDTQPREEELPLVKAEREEEVESLQTTTSRAEESRNGNRKNKRKEPEKPQSAPKEARSSGKDRKGRRKRKSSDEDEEEETTDEDEVSEEEIVSQSTKRGRANPEEHEDCVIVRKGSRIGERRFQSMLNTYQRPPLAWPADLNPIQRREAVHFQRKMRAFRNLKNHLLTANCVDLREEAEQKNWGPLPDDFETHRPKHNLTHIEAMFYYWSIPFKELEKLWLKRHMKEFEVAWRVPVEEVMTSPILTPYMRFIRCFPTEELWAVNPKLRTPIDAPRRSQMELPLTGTNMILDAKTVLTYYGMHRLKEWEVHDNIDYDMMDFQILLEELREAAKPILMRLKLDKVTRRNQIKMEQYQV